MNEEELIDIRLEDEDEYIDRMIDDFLNVVKVFQQNHNFDNASMVRLMEDTIIKLKEE